jgi:hypothetical protein
MNGDLRPILDKLDRLTEGQAELRARVEVSLAQQTEEIGALFRYRNDHEKQISNVREQMAPLMSGAARRAAIWSSAITGTVISGANIVWQLMLRGGA